MTGNIKTDKIIGKLLIAHEGVKLKPYICTSGKLTIGVGRNLEDLGLSNEEVFFLLRNDISRVKKEAEKFIWFNDLNEVRQAAICDMLFNLGLSKFMKFQKFIYFMSIKDYENASIEMLNSKWALQVGQRAVTLSNILKTGVESYDVKR